MEFYAQEKQSMPSTYVEVNILDYS